MSWSHKVAFGAVSVITCVSVMSCGDKPVPPHGKVTDHTHSDEYWYWQAGVTSCDSKGMCTTNPGYMQYMPPEWVIEVTDFKNKNWSGEVHVEPDVYDKCPVNASWPECWGGTPPRPGTE